jgi:ParB-like chromosome segregation protein Spo0J
MPRKGYRTGTIDIDTAKKFRGITDKELKISAIDQISLAGVKDVSYESLLKKPPVLLASGQILDGNHRIERAIKAKLPRIPVLVQVKK